jgi:hypothetical protein
MRRICVCRRISEIDTVRISDIGIEVKMDLTGVAFGTTDWAKIEPVAYAGETGTAYWRTCHFGTTRVRMVEYSAGYLADHWCWRGHVLLCLEGELYTELEDGRTFTLTPGMSYQVGNDMEGHRSSTAMGAKLFVVD